MTKTLFKSPVKIAKEQTKQEIIDSYKSMKKNPKNSVAEWIRVTASKYGKSEYTIKSYIYN